MKPITLPIAHASARTTGTRRRFNELTGLLLLLASVLLLLALVSYHPGDPSLDTVGAQTVHNWTGRVGATLSDLLLQLEGAAAFLLPVLLFGYALGRMRSRPTLAPRLKLAGFLLSLITIPGLFALLPGHFHVYGALPIGGILGTLLVDQLVTWINLPGTCVLLLFLAAASLYLLTAFSLTGGREWLLVHFAFFASWRDRLTNFRRNRSQRRSMRREAKAQNTLLRAEAEALLANSDADPDSDANSYPDEDSALYEDHSALPATHPAYAADTASDAAAAYLTPQELASLHTPAAPWHDDGDRTPLPRRGSFAEVATGWDDESFSAALAAAPAATPAMPNIFAASEPALSVREPITPPTLRPQLVRSAAPDTRVDPAGSPAATAGPVFGQRADANQQSVTMTARTVSGFASAYKLPPTTLLHRSEDSHEVRQEELRLEAQVLVEKCGEFDVNGQVVQINPGPVVTTFEFRPDAGVKYSRVTGLADDLCLAMAAESILIERMAGKSTVGIQVPNAERETIWLRDIIEAEAFAHSKSKITMAMGKDINGRVVVADLATMPHVLIAGSTGSGKSVAINAMIMSVLYKATPEQVRLILVDPKRVELGMYEGIPHLFTPIITEPKLAANALKNAVREMERRLKLLASRSVRNIDQYNRLFDDQPTLWDEQGVEETPLPYIMIIIDELADLMILDKSNVEEAITRLAQMARAVGIHLVLATQRPSVDVITGLIKANVPTRMSFRLATKIDSRTILDANGAESLLGRGDMLFLPPGTSRVQRVHAPFVTEKEIAGVVSFWKAQGEANYVEAFLDAPKDDKGRDLDGDGTGGDDNDELFDDAVRLVFEFGKASTSLLQRRMRIGYGRAAHLIDLMERDGLVGPPEGSKPREILKSAGWLKESDEALR
jgi:S-DNA-T family DNA segregation ATPase FtsK/SpoIIIE